MIKKRDTCLYCGEQMKSKTAKKKFCSGKCKVYWHRESLAAIEYVPNFTPTSKANIEKFEAVIKEEFSKVLNPRNLEELKTLCPKDLKGFDRSEWISANRLKYGI